MSRKKLIVGNWKMHGGYKQCRASVPLLSAAICQDVDLVLCPPAPFLGEVAALASGTELAYGAQDVSAYPNGARTGEWSAEMLIDLGCRYAIVGHSERRQYHQETDSIVATKAQACVNAGITPIVCIGETGVERTTGVTEEVLARQLAALLIQPGWRRAVIAYEPVWAIGTGLAATPDLAQQAHAFIRQELAKVDPNAASLLPILYGGSIKPESAADLFAMADIDGGLIGGASLEVDSLLAIYQAA